jgi:hypothetical protein
LLSHGAPVFLQVLFSAGSGPYRSYPYLVLISQVLFRAPSAEVLPLEVVAPVPVRALPGVVQLDAEVERISQEAVVPEVCAPSAAAAEHAPVAVRSDFRDRED